MNDISRHLPFSQSGGADETGVTGDWRPLTASTLDVVADLLEGLEPAEWESPSRCEGWRVRDVAGHLVWRLGSSVTQLATSSARAVFRERIPPSRVVDELSRRAARSTPEELVASIRSLARERVSASESGQGRGRGRGHLADLTEAVVHGYDISHALGLPLTVPAVASGAVAVARSLHAPSTVKPIVTRRTLRATDADWTVGRGEEIAAPAATIILFLFGRIALDADDARAAPPGVGPAPAAPPTG
ncbi:maleylpyruvate isomerase family mycothiol-dependent enzyme [Marisediminicola sp. LYQ85]|uniref:maleylpyruvate isomerase family mycothiol-dependent enzyme n=1 Tax=Marisediminicola sp. LYQ85 TaxID=3391062 RepID=UPI0039835DC4